MFGKDAPALTTAPTDETDAVYFAAVQRTEPARPAADPRVRALEGELATARATIDELRDELHRLSTRPGRRRRR